MTEQEKVAASGGFELMDREDEAQILEELRGAMSEKFIYKNSRGQYELSYAGTKWAVREMANKGEAIRIEGHPKVDRCPLDPEYITVTVLAKRVKVDLDAKCETVLDNNVGAARGWIKQKLLDGRIIPDEFFYNKTISKATRNVQQSLIPQDFKREIIDLLVKKGSGQLPAAAAKAPKKPAPAPAGAPPAAAPASGAPPAAQKAPPAASKPAPGQAPREAALDVMCQRFEIVLKQASGAGADRAKMTAFLKTLTGKDAVNKLSKGEIQELGPILHGLTKGASRYEAGVIYDSVTGEQTYPKPEPQHEEAPAQQVEPTPEPQQEDGPPGEPQEPMF